MLKRDRVRRGWSGLRDSFLGNHRNFVFLRHLLALLLVVTPFCGLASMAQSIGEFESGTELYRRYATINEKGVVRKFVKTEPLSLQAVCVTHQAHRCNDVTLSQRIKDSFGRNSRVKLTVVKEKPDLQIFFTDASGTEILKQKMSALYAGSYQDFGDPDCQLFYSIHENTIEKASIVVSLDSSELKQRVCLTLQFPHAMGLALPNAGSFTHNWPITSEGIDLSRLTDKQLSAIKTKLDVLTYIHMCPDLKPGLNGVEIKQVLGEKSNCLIGLKHTSN